MGIPNVTRTELIQLLIKKYFDEDSVLVRTEDIIIKTNNVAVAFEFIADLVKSGIAFQNSGTHDKATIIIGLK